MLKEEEKPQCGNILSPFTGTLYNTIRHSWSLAILIFLTQSNTTVTPDNYCSTNATKSTHVLRHAIQLTQRIRLDLVALLLKKLLYFAIYSNHSFLINLSTETLLFPNPMYYSCLATTLA